MSVASVSKLVTDLESRLSVKLLERSTRVVKPTSAGEIYASRLRSILAGLDQLELEVSESNHNISGELYISAPMDYGKRQIAPLIGKFLQLYPEVSVRIDYSDSLVNLFDQPFDLAIRAGQLIDSGLISKKIDAFRILAAASPGYLLNSKLLDHPDDLEHHNTLGYAHSGNTWEFVDEYGQTIKSRTKPRLVANNGEALVQSAISGAGVVYQPDFMLRDEFSKRSLIQQLEPYTHRMIGVYLLYVSKEYMPGKLRAFIDFISGELKN